MQLTASKRADGDYYQSEEYVALLDEAGKQIRLQKFLVRYGPNDDYSTLIDEATPFAEFLKDADKMQLVLDWFGESRAADLLEKIRSLA
ncbi:MAG TPA: hypothetical protein PLP21_00745 [Pyrinomonadaceae bacterium]|nr:hypothetical protein [Acidobacteriota bacterium]HQZ94808.1 hypothetical protein [Pyrinomonadaceae bacterium]